LTAWLDTRLFLLNVFLLDEIQCLCVDIGMEAKDVARNHTVLSFLLTQLSGTGPYLSVLERTMEVFDQSQICPSVSLELFH
jgi:hypothetical protein